MKKVAAICAAIMVLSVVVAYAAWMGNKNHHCQVRIPDGWNTEYQVMVKEDGKQAHIITGLDNEANPTMVAAIVSMELAETIDLKLFKDFFEKNILKDPVVVESQKRGFNNLKGIYVIYEANFGGKPFRLMCFFTKHDCDPKECKGTYFYAVFTGAEKDKFDEAKPKLDELLVTFNYVP